MVPYFRLTKCQDLNNQYGLNTDLNCVKPGDDEEQLILRRSRRLKTLPLMISCCKTNMCFYKFPFAAERFWNGLKMFSQCLAHALEPGESQKICPMQPRA